MTKVILFADEADHLLGFQIDGHSGYGLKGEDIVCAAISVLATNTANALEVLSGELPDEARRDREPASFICLYDSAPGERASLLLEAFALGIESIRKEYGDYVRVERQVRR